MKNVEKNDDRRGKSALKRLLGLLNNAGLTDDLFEWLRAGIELSLGIGLSYLLLIWLFNWPIKIVIDLILAVIIIQCSLGMGRGLTAFIWAIGKVFSNAWKEYKAQ